MVKIDGTRDAACRPRQRAEILLGDLLHERGAEGDRVVVPLPLVIGGNVAPDRERDELRDGVVGERPRGRHGRGVEIREEGDDLRRGRVEEGFQTIDAHAVGGIGPFCRYPSSTINKNKSI